MNSDARLTDKETLKNLLAITVAGRLKRAVENQTLDPIFNTRFLKRKFGQMTKSGKRTAEWLLYAAGAAVNVFLPQDTPVQKMTNEVISDALQEGGKKAAEMPCLGQNESVSTLEQTLELGEEKLRELTGWLESLNEKERVAFWEEIRTLSISKLVEFLEVDQVLRTKLLNLISAGMKERGTVSKFLLKETKELRTSISAFNRRLADKRKEIRVRRQGYRQERRVGQ